MSNYFVLMNKDRALANLMVNRNYIDVLRYDKVLDTLFANPCEWIKGRIESARRHNINDIFKVGNIDTLEECIKVTHCVSATDTFWFKTLNETTNWQDVSVFSNRISKLIANAAIDGVHLLGNANAKSPSPQYNVIGTADKCIKRENGKLILFKSSGIAEFGINTRPYVEGVVTQVAKALGFKTVVTYDVKETYIRSRNCYKPYCMCELVTNENTGLINYCDSKYNETNLMQLAKQFMITNDKVGLQRLREMLLLDSICMNVDRHDENYAFEYDTNKLSIRTLSRAFDFDCSLGATLPVLSKSVEDDYNKLMNIGPKTLNNFNKQAEIFVSRSIYDKLKDVGTIKIDFSEMNGLNKKRRDLIEYIINRRIKEIVALIDTRV